MLKSTEHIQNDTDSPHVYLIARILLVKYLGSFVIYTCMKSECLLISLMHGQKLIMYFGNAEVTDLQNLNIFNFIDQNVLRLNVSVVYFVVVNELNA